MVLTTGAFSQRRISGKIVEVIDGKTAVVQVGTSGRLTVVLQYVEIPEPEQPLHELVKAHLEKLVLGKSATVIPRGVSGALTVGQLFVDGVDISQQMIRDGAAWFALPEKTEKSGAESELYLSNEALARKEKRGIWSIEDLQPAWEFRAAKAERLRAEEAARLEEIKKQSEYKRGAGRKLPPPPAVSSNFELWKAGRTATLWDEMDVLIGNPEYDQNGLFRLKFDKYPVEAYLTQPLFLDMSGGNNPPKISCQFGYFFRNDDKEGKREFLGLVCRAESAKASFKDTNELVFSADGKNINFKNPIWRGRPAGQRFNEMLVFTLNRDALLKIAGAKSVRLKIGGFSASMPGKMHTAVKSMALEISKSKK
jgi:endonuclease YncB( thermonuclease family)